MKLYEVKENDITIEKMVEKTISYTLFMITQTHIWHWQVKSYAKHEALGDFYESLQGKVDAVAEYFMGAGGSFNVLEAQPSLKEYGDSTALSELHNFKRTLSQYQAAIMDEENHELHSVGDEILAIVKDTDKLLYLLTLE